MFPPWNFLKITWTHLTRGAGIQGQAFNSTIIFLPLQSLLLLPGKMLRMWQFKGAVFKVSWTLYQLLAQHLCMWSGSSLLSLFIFLSLQLHLSESNKTEYACGLSIEQCITSSRQGVGIVAAAIPGRGAFPSVWESRVGAIPVHRLTFLHSLDCSRSIYTRYKAIVNWSAAFVRTFVLQEGLMEQRCICWQCRRHWGVCVLKKPFSNQGGKKIVRSLKAIAIIKQRLMPGPHVCTGVCPPGFSCNHLGLWLFKCYRIAFHFNLQSFNLRVTIWNK